MYLPSALPIGADPVKGLASAAPIFALSTREARKRMMDVKERRAMQDWADALVNDWLFQPNRREEVVRTLAQTKMPIRATLLVAMMGRRLSQDDLTERAEEIAAAT